MFFKRERKRREIKREFAKASLIGQPFVGHLIGGRAPVRGPVGVARCGAMDEEEVGAVALGQYVNVVTRAAEGPTHSGGTG